MSKVLKITDDLRNMILQGNFADNKLPGERELAIQFQCGRNTIRTVLTTLAKEGRIDRFRKKGTVIREQKNSRGNVALIMRTMGHFYEDLYENILSRLRERKYFVNTVNTNIIFQNNFHVRPQELSALQKKIENLVNSKPELILLHTYMKSKIPCFNELCKFNTILFGEKIDCRNLPLKGVFPDYEKAGYIGGKYLIEQGCKKPVYYPNFFDFKTHITPELYMLHKEKMLIDGFKRALTEGGINPETAIIDGCFAAQKDHRKQLVYLSTIDRYMPDGFLSSDANVVFFMKKLIENCGQIPKNICFAGLFNTPWSRGEGPQNFTSIDFNTDAIADAIVQMAETPAANRKDIYISPELIIR